MSALGKEILRSGTVHAADGAPRPLSAQTPLVQCEFLADLVRTTDARTCLEVGLAYGASALFIGEELRGKEGAVLHSLDLQQHTFFDGIGLLNLERAGLAHLTKFHEGPSHAVLPRLLADGVRLDLAYVDTTKVFDIVLVDAYYLTRMLRVGGLLVFDDCDTWPGIRRVVRYLSTWPHLRVHSTCRPYPPSAGKRLLSGLARSLPVRKVFRDDVLRPDFTVGLNAGCVAFEKVAEDPRDWQWYADF